jgi:NAD(P)-dependent dehydrogenase (short-subunit alcohol dehydrogenase family)
MDMEIHNKTYVVSAAAVGVGLSLAEHPARQGASVIGSGCSVLRCAETECKLRGILSSRS